MKKRRWSKRCTVSVLALLVAACAADEEARELRPEGPLQSDVDAVMRPYAESGNFSGAVLITMGDEEMAEAAYGYADLTHDVAVTPATRFQIGSISKSFTAASILLLEERGLLGLEDPISRFLPEFPDGDEITVHHLLSHTSGLPRFVFQPDYVDRSMRHHTASDLVAWVSELPPAAPPGARAAYSNANYSVLAAIVEQVSGSSYPDFLKKEILEPLTLEDTGIAGDATEIISGLADGIQPVGRVGFARARYFDYTSVLGAGAVYSTARDLDRWHRALRGGELLGAGSLERFFSREIGDQAYVWRVFEFDGRPAVSVQGWDGVGFSGKLFYLEEEDLTIVVLCNLNISSVTSEIVDALAFVALGQETDRLEFDREPADPGELRALAGVYRFGSDFYVPNTSIEFVEDDGELTVEGMQPGALLRLEDGSMIHRQHWFRVAFERDSDGRISGIRYGTFRAARVDGS